jgi:hypothetical protein
MASVTSSEPLCRDIHPCSGPETTHWNNGEELFAWDCLEPANHPGFCKSEVVTDRISIHRLYWSLTDDDFFWIIRGQPAPSFIEVLFANDPTLDYERVYSDTCEDCNYDRHRCGGCGEEVGHYRGQTGCPACIGEYDPFDTKEQWSQARCFHRWKNQVCLWCGASVFVVLQPRCAHSWGWYDNPTRRICAKCNKTEVIL